MPITEFLEKNAKLWPDDVALVEINPELQEKSRVTWREYSLIEQGANGDGRSEITWEDFDKRANRFANLLLVCLQIFLKLNILKVCLICFPNLRLPEKNVLRQRVG